MDLAGWNERYRSEWRAGEDWPYEPSALVRKTATLLPAGRALDLACGTGRNALWLAKQGWKVTAVDGAESAIDILATRAPREKLPIDTHVANLRLGGFALREANWDLILITYYLQRDLFEGAKRALAPGGLMVVIVHTTEGDEEPTEFRLTPGELPAYFAGWEILHEYEGQPNDPEHKRRVAELVARRPR